MIASSPVVKSWQAAFDAQQSVRADQRAAFAEFLARGLPTQKNDAWKYTDLRRLTMRQFRQGAGAPLTQEIEALLLPLRNCRRLLFIDGVLQPSFKPSEAGQAVARANTNAFDLLNVALAVNPVRVEVRGEGSDQPIYLACIWTHNANALMSHPRVNLVVHPNAKASLVEHHVGLNTEPNLVNSAIDISIGADAILEHIRIQDDALTNFNVGSIHANVARGAHYVNHHYVLGGALARTDLSVRLDGEGAQTELHGLIFAQTTQHLDVRTCVEHATPNTRSREDYRGIADHRGRVIFNGKVIVAKDAQRTDAAQSSRNLLLSPQAEVDTRPELEIYADDVKCAHGATVGQLDASALFYLRSRGIESGEARALLTHAFATEVIERIPLPAIREYVLARLMTRMRSGKTQ